jgi:MerR family transcriptional regulator, light-induced transcriptional regulator
MNNVKNIFSIKDLENLSGIKAHTIRIWEKRYNVLQPMRTDTNIRYYDTAALQKLLNISLLHNHGYKISKISKMDDAKIPEMVNDIISRKSVGLHAVNAFKVAMMRFDQALFIETYDRLLAQKTFPEIFYEAILPLMEEIGLLWQTNTITPAQEHFISNLVRQKILVNTEKLQALAPTRHDKIFVLYLPEGEIHEIGLMYLNYEMLRQGYKAIYLGANVPLSCLTDVKKYFDTITYVSYFTIAPHPEDINNYIDKLRNDVMQPDAELWLLGRNTSGMNPEDLPNQVRVFDSIVMCVKEL